MLLDSLKNEHFLGFGTNKYPKMGNSATLHKCTSDVKKLGEVLIKYLDFDSVWFTEEETTKIKILNRINKAVEECYQIFDETGEKQYLLISRSSHGTQQPTPVSLEEPDGFSEAICCWDTSWNASKNCWNKVIEDNELCDIFNVVDETKLALDFCADFCHSGDFTKSMDDLKPVIEKSRRFLYPRDYKQYKVKAKVQSWWQKTFYNYWIRTNTFWALFAGSSPHNYSYEISGGGALTMSIIDYIKYNHKNLLSRRKAAKIIIDGVKKRVAKQTPHLECSEKIVDKTFLTATEIKPASRGFWSGLFNSVFGWIL